MHSSVGRHAPCPKCRSADTRRSRRRGVFEHALRLLAIRILRCRACSHRFYELGHSALNPADLRRSFKRVALLLLVAAGVLLCVWLVRLLSGQMTASS